MILPPMRLLAEVFRYDHLGQLSLARAIIPVLPGWWRISDMTVMEGDPVNSVGQRIAKLRESMDYTQQDLAKVFGVSRSAVNAWEMGKAVPSSQLMPQIAQFFHVSTDYLYGMESSASIDLSGLDDKDIETVISVAQRLREKNRM